MAKLNFRQIMHEVVKPTPLTEAELVCYSYHKDTHEFMGVTIADESPREPGVIHWPANTTPIPIPRTLPVGQVWVWEQNNWIIVENHRGEILVDSDGNQHMVTSLGPLPPNMTPLPRTKEV